MHPQENLWIYSSTVDTARDDGRGAGEQLGSDQIPEPFQGQKQK